MKSLAQLVGNVDALNSWQRAGLWLVHVLAWLQELIYRNVLRSEVWHSADGRVRLLSQMDNQHLLNAERMLRRNGGQREKIQALADERRRRYERGRRPGGAT